MEPATTFKTQTIPSECQENEYLEVAWGVLEFSGYNKCKHVPLWIPRPKVTDYQVKYELHYAGICHTDCSAGSNEWHMTTYPVVSGHEHAGIVTEVGAKVTKVKVGDKVGVGYFVDCCMECNKCKKGEEQYCEKTLTLTFGGQKNHGRVEGNPNLTTFGGYSGSNVVHEYFVMKIPDEIPFEAAAPILCAGITLYDPLRYWGALEKKDMVIGVIGVGGLGTMGIKLSKYLGHTVVAISRSQDKESLVKEKGADHYVASQDSESMKNCPVKCDLILNTVGATHDIRVYMPLLAQDGIIVQLGGCMAPQMIFDIDLMYSRKTIAGSLVGGIKATEDCLELCAKSGIFPDIQLIEAKEIDWAWDQLMGEGGNKDGIRYVIDIKRSLLNKDFLPS